MRKWSAIKAVFKEDKIASFRSELAHLKSTLTLAEIGTLRYESSLLAYKFLTLIAANCSVEQLMLILWIKSTPQYCFKKAYRN